MKTNLTVEIVNVTPELAKNYLKFNDKNRKISEKNLLFLIKEMLSGRFTENGESIVFDNYGILKNGQHRLTAIVKSGMSYNIPIVRGVKSNVMPTFDTGKNRSASDILYLNGFKQATNIASLINSINTFVIKNNKSSISRGSNTRGYKITNQEVLEYCQNNYDWLLEIVKNSQKIYNSSTTPKVLNASQIGLIAYIIGGENPNKKVYDFLNNAIGLSRTMETATSYLYTKLYNSKINKEPMNFYWVLGMSIKAYNYYIEGNPSVKFFKFDISQNLPKVNKIN